MRSTRDINTALRTGAGLEDPHLAQTIDNIQHALERTRTPEDPTVISGMNLEGEKFLKVDSIGYLPGRTVSS